MSAASFIRRAAGAAAWLPLAVLLHDQVCGVAPAGLLHAHAASQEAAASSAAAASAPAPAPALGDLGGGAAAVSLLSSSSSSPSSSPSRRRPRPRDAVLADEAVLVRRLSAPGAGPLRRGALVVFRAPSRDAAAPGGGRAVASVAAVAGDVVFGDAHRGGAWGAPRAGAGRYSLVGEGQVVLAPQPRLATAAGDREMEEDEEEEGGAPPGAERDFGLLPLALVEGRAVAVVWPPAAARWLGGGEEGRTQR